ncbi:MAG: hypothetical protein QNJ42_08905 [Crocosphaera sp.]|nr:hypothetical protein [Crocosphaera sp.]
MALTNEQIEERINQQSTQINKIDTILELQRGLTYEVKNLALRISGVENTLESIDNKLTSQTEKISKIEGFLEGQNANIQKIPDLSEKVGELKNWRPIALVVIGGLMTLSVGVVTPDFSQINLKAQSRDKK